MIFGKPWILKRQLETKGAETTARTDSKILKKRDNRGCRLYCGQDSAGLEPTYVPKEMGRKIGPWKGNGKNGRKIPTETLRMTKSLLPRPEHI